jgi:hypothetical protein
MELRRTIIRWLLISAWVALCLLVMVWLIG